MNTIVNDPRFQTANRRFEDRIRAAQGLPRAARKKAEAAANRSLAASVAAIHRWAKQDA